MSPRPPPSAHVAHPDRVPPCLVIPREARARVDRLLSRAPAVVLTGPRQVGKTTLALEFARERNAAYLDLEDPRDRTKLEDIHKYCDHNSHRLVILDEIHRLPGLFEPLRGIIDQRRREGRRAGHFLLLGSASIDLLRQTGEDARRASGVLRDATPEHSGGGQPGCGRSLASRRNAGRLLAPNAPTASNGGSTSFAPTSSVTFRPSAKDSWRDAASLLDHAGPRSGTPFNAALLARSLGISGRTVGRYLDLMVDLLLVRRLVSWRRNVGKRLVKAPRTYLRDSGICHALLGIETFDALLGHPVWGAAGRGS